MRAHEVHGILKFHFVSSKRKKNVDIEKSVENNTSLIIMHRNSIRANG